MILEVNGEEFWGEFVTSKDGQVDLELYKDGNLAMIYKNIKAQKGGLPPDTNNIETTDTKYWAKDE